MKRGLRRVVLLALFLLLAVPALLQAQTPVVYGVFFYSPSCPHCHKVIGNDWPKIQAEFGDQLQVLFIDASGVQGNALMQSAREALAIEANGVPMLIIGTEVMVGSLQIPTRAPILIREGLAAGGIALPPIPGIEAVYQAAVEQVEQQSSDEPPAPGDMPSLADRLAADPIANAAALLVLALLAASLAGVLLAYGSSLVRGNNGLLDWLGGRFGRMALILLALMGLALALSLAAGGLSDALVLLIAVGEAAAFLAVLVMTLRAPPLPQWLLPLAALAGLAVAIYLAVVEITLSEAVCGVVGNCNTVQQSQYARVLNIPIGVIGSVGYLAVMAVWAAGRIPRLRWLRPALLELCLFGVAFSTYLTFLEPFVIGATCVWCLLSAVWMLLLLWLALQFTTPVVKGAETPETLAASPA